LFFAEDNPGEPETKMGPKRLELLHGIIMQSCIPINDLNDIEFLCRTR